MKTDTPTATGIVQMDILDIRSRLYMAYIMERGGLDQSLRRTIKKN